MRAAALLALALGCGSPAAQESREYVLDDPVYRFCHEPGAHGLEARTWCELVQDLPPERCPGFQETCLDPSVVEPRGCAMGGIGGGDPTSLPGAPPERPWSTPTPQGCDAEGCEAQGCEGDAAAGVGTLLKWLTAFGVAAVLLVVIRLIVGAVGRPRRRPVRAEAAPAPEEEPLPDVPDLPSDDLLGAARRALDEGRHAEAVLLARGAALRRLGEANRLRLHRARTDREYARQVRKDKDLHEPLREVLAAAEVHRWGGRPLDRDLAARALGAAEQILTRLGAAVVLLALLVGASPASAQTFPGFGRHGPYGDAALRDLLETYGYEATWRQTPLTELDESVDVLVLDLVGLSPADEDWAAVDDWVEQGGVLVVAGRLPDRFPRVGTLTLLGSGHRTRLGEELAPYLPDPRWPRGADAVYVGAEGRPWVVAVGEARSQPDPAAPEAAGEEAPADALWLAEGETAPVVVEVSHGEGVILAIADDRLLTNGFLLTAANETFLGDLLHTGQGPMGWPLPTPIRVELATRAVVDSDSPPGQAANPRLIPFVLQLLFTWVLLVLWRGWPFGVLRDSRSEGRVRFVDHVDALAARYQRAGGEGHAAGAVARLWLHRVGPQGLLLAARRAGYDARAAQRLVQDAEAAADGRGGDLELVEELWRVTRRK